MCGLGELLAYLLKQKTQTEKYAHVPNLRGKKSYGNLWNFKMYSYHFIINLMRKRIKFSSHMWLQWKLEILYKPSPPLLLLLKLLKITQKWFRNPVLDAMNCYIAWGWHWEKYSSWAAVKLKEYRLLLQMRLLVGWGLLAGWCIQEADFSSHSLNSVSFIPEFADCWNHMGSKVCGTQESVLHLSQIYLAMEKYVKQNWKEVWASANLMK